MDMKHLAMTWRKETRLSPVPPPGRGPEGRGGSAFDLWLRRGLHQLFDDVAKEPVPEELLRLIEGDRALTADAAARAKPRARRRCGRHRASSDEAGVHRKLGDRSPGKVGPQAGRRYGRRAPVREA